MLFVYFSALPPMVHSAKKVVNNTKDQRAVEDWRKNNDKVKKLLLHLLFWCFVFCFYLMKILFIVIDKNVTFNEYPVNLRYISFLVDQRYRQRQFIYTKRNA